MSIELDALSFDELKALQKQVDAAIKGFEARKRSEARAEIEAVAAKHGFKLADLVGGAPGKPVGAPKYRHPENPAVTWTGRGRQPAWIKEALAAGKSLDEFAI